MDDLKQRKRLTPAAAGNKDSARAKHKVSRFATSAISASTTERTETNRSQSTTANALHNVSRETPFPFPLKGESDPPAIIFIAQPHEMRFTAENISPMRRLPFYLVGFHPKDVPHNLSSAEAEPLNFDLATLLASSPNRKFSEVEGRKKGVFNNE